MPGPFWRAPRRGARPFSAPVSLACSNQGMGVRRPGWWCYPERCSNGHEWGSDLVIVAWRLCDCPPAVASLGGYAGAGHELVYCKCRGRLPVGVVTAAARAGDVWAYGRDLRP
jgi:hypothetical protein